MEENRMLPLFRTFDPLTRLRQHGGNPPDTSERQDFKKRILTMKVKSDEENFDEAEAQAYRCWTETKVSPSCPSSCLATQYDPRPTSGPLRDRSPVRRPRDIARSPPSEPFALLPPPSRPQGIH